MQIFHCGMLYTPMPEPERTCLLVENGTIVDALTPKQAEAIEDAERIDLSESLVGPGLCDIHCHGAIGSDFSDGTVEDVRKAAEYQLQQGTTSLLATIGSCSIEEMLASCQTCQQLMHDMPSLAGIHLEGPYFDKEWYGCHLESMIRCPKPLEWEQLDPYRSLIRLITIAPELPGAVEMIRSFTQSGTTMSIGHSTATYEDIRIAIDAGLRHATHLFSAMPKASRQDLVLQPGVLESVLMLDELSTELIADGIHVGPRLMEFAVKVKGAGRTALVSDSLRGVGCGPGDYAFGPRNGVLCRLVDSPRSVGVSIERADTLASSAIVLSDGLRVCRRETTISLADAWRMASTTPAGIIGLRAKGKLLPGYDADILALNSDMQICNVFLRGRQVTRTTASI